MSQDSPEDTPGWTGGAQGSGSGRPGWPEADPHGRPPQSRPRPHPSGPPQPGQPQPPQHGQPQYRQPSYGPPQYGPQQYGGLPQYGNQYAPPPGLAYPPPGYQAGPGVPGSRAAGSYGQQSQSDDRTWAILGYLLTFVGGFIAPLIVYLVKKDQSPFVRHHAAQALNLTITSAIYSIGLFVLAIIAGAITHGLGLLLVLLYFPLALTFIVFLIMAAVAANRFEMFQVPRWACLRFVH
jgi:uncharacterized protein